MSVDEKIARLKSMYNEAGLADNNLVIKDVHHPRKNFVQLSFERNQYLLRGIEIIENTRDGEFFRIYYNKNMASELKVAISKLPNIIHLDRAETATDFQGTDYLEILLKLKESLENETIIDAAKKTTVRSSSSKWAGAELLSDIDVSDEELLELTFTIDDLISINEETSDNKLKEQLSTRNGVYMIRTPDGITRYIGSAYNGNGLLGRWNTHIDNGGDADFLKVYITFNGWRSVVFTVLEFTDKDGATGAETKWKKKLGTKNTGLYDGIRLNRN